MVPGNYVKAVAFCVLWLITFNPLVFQEIILFFSVCSVFSVLDVMAVKQGVFYFKNPDFLGIPVWECLMYGFYVLHGLRLLGGPQPKTNKIVAGMFAVGFALSFSCIADQSLLTYVTFALMGLSLIFFHERYDLIYVGYFVLMGAVIEYVGVGFGIWGYPGVHVIGLPLWFITMWGSIGLFLRRLILPILA